MCRSGVFCTALLVLQSVLVWARGCSAQANVVGCVAWTPILWADGTEV
jgi:hypothetical protein